MMLHFRDSDESVLHTVRLNALTVMKSVDSGKPLYITPHAKKWLLVELVLELDKINIRDVPLLSASVTVVNTARELASSLTVNCSWTRKLLLSTGAVTTN